MRAYSLSMIVRQDADMLERFLPLTSPHVPEKFALVFPSTDGSREVLERYGFWVWEEEWKGSYAGARNRLNELVRGRSSLPWTVQLDADEVLSRWDVLDRVVEGCPHPAILFPRYNLSTLPGQVLAPGMQLHWQDWTYPDPQMRMVRLDAPVSYRLDVHEVLWNLAQDRQHYQTGLYGTGPHIYHYGATRPLTRLWLKHHNYNQLAAGQPPLTTCPFSEAELAGRARPLPHFPHPHPYA